GAFICDAPAKSFILCIKGHTGYYSCTKCTVRGTYINGRVCFPDLTASLRTDADFRSVSQEEHHLHTGPSISLELPVDIVKQVPLEYMHLVCLGVVHKLLVMWFRGPRPTRLGSQVRDSVSAMNIALARYVPSDFNRKPRSLSDLDR
ncbi:unnamed protein product, partial [Ixodes pacificus]